MKKILLGIFCAVMGVGFFGGGVEAVALGKTCENIVGGSNCDESDWICNGVCMECFSANDCTSSDENACELKQGTNYKICIPCKINGDCSGQICKEDSSDITKNICVECVGNNDCLDSDKFCGTEGFCEEIVDCDSFDDYQSCIDEDSGNTEYCFNCDLTGKPTTLFGCIESNGGAINIDECCRLFPDVDNEYCKELSCEDKKGILLTEGQTKCPKSDQKLVDGNCCIPQGCDNPTDAMIKNCECGVKLNTEVPFVGDCIQLNIGGKKNTDDGTTVVSTSTAFPILMGGLSKILVTAILVFSFILVIVAGVMMTTGGISESNFSQGKQLLMKVIAGLALLGASGVILKLINPSFFG